MLARRTRALRGAVMQISVVAAMLVGMPFALRAAGADRLSAVRHLLGRRDSFVLIRSRCASEPPWPSERASERYG
jgi:hypothetical protein